MPRCARWFAALGFACFAVAVQLTSAVAAITVTDDRGKTISLERPAQRIVALAPNLTEIAFAAGAGADLVGVSARSDFPKQARRLPVVADSGRIDLERIVALRPDLVLAWLSGNPKRPLEVLQQLGIPVMALEVRRLHDIPRLLRLVGRVSGHAGPAERAARRIERSIRALKLRYSGLPRLRVFVEIWHDPLITVNGTHLISQVLRVCGGSNVFAHAAALTPVVSLEALLVAQPQVVIMASGAGTPAEQAARWRGMRLLPAVQRGTLYAIDPDLLLREGPRLIEAARAVCAALQGARAKWRRQG